MLIKEVRKIVEEYQVKDLTTTYYEDDELDMVNDAQIKIPKVLLCKSLINYAEVKNYARRLIKS